MTTLYGIRPGVTLRYNDGRPGHNVTATVISMERRTMTVQARRPHRTNCDPLRRQGLDATPFL